MPAPQKRARRTTQQAPSGLLSGITNIFGGGWRNFFSDTRRFTQSGLVSMGSLAWYVVTSAMVVVLPIRRAVEMDVMMDEQQRQHSQSYSPDSVLPSVPGLYGGGSGSSVVPVTPHF